MNSGDEIPEHILVDILDLMNICAVFYGLDVVIAEGIGCLRDHAAADGRTGDERCGNDRLVLDPHLMVVLVTILQSAQDRNRILGRRFIDHDF